MEDMKDMLKLFGILLWQALFFLAISAVLVSGASFLLGFTPVGAFEYDLTDCLIASLILMYSLAHYLQTQDKGTAQDSLNRISKKLDSVMEFQAVERHKRRL